MADFQSTTRFSDRVDDYVRYRSDYPVALLDWLQREQGVDRHWRVADVGAGTGISSKMFLDAGYRVTAVEPNAPMRAAAEQWLRGYDGFDAVDGRADATKLADASVDLVTVAQAFCCALDKMPAASADPRRFSTACCRTSPSRLGSTGTRMPVSRA